MQGYDCFCTKTMQRLMLEYFDTKTSEIQGLSRGGSRFKGEV
ncbi:hypothetical protein MNBD_GAMMA09-2651 [hydrothermal vent metagenome]|uniref:Uncharacterized protein n=1 Tax=hydrothermal vent metagenome TaxID=652676 RepID=A0A3B0YCN1_9ZZZZ